jgi:hypothetical protein
MSLFLILAADFIERASDPAQGPEVNDDHAMRWAVAREERDAVLELGLGKLGPEDVELLSPPAWLWLTGALREQDPELPYRLADALYDASEDPLFRLSFADAMLRHPRIRSEEERWAVGLEDQPQSWMRDKILRLLEDAKGDKEDGDERVREIATILLQVSNAPSLALLRGLYRARPNALEALLRNLAVRNGEAEGSLIERLGLRRDL